MEKTEGKKTVIVIDEQGNKLESTYPKRAKGLIKNGRAQYVDENTICLAGLPKQIILEDKRMNNNIKLEENKKVAIDLSYIMMKIDDIIEMNKKALTSINFAEMSVVPDAIHPIQALCETNNKLVDFLSDIYKTLQPKEMLPNNKEVIESLSIALNNAINENLDEGVIDTIVCALSRFKD